MLASGGNASRPMKEKAKPTNYFKNELHTYF